MMGFFKRQKKTPNRVFGEVKRFDSSWSTSVKPDIELWGQKYELSCSVYTDSETSEISQAQEDVYVRFRQELSAIQKQVERIVADYYEVTDPEVLLSKFTPYEFIISSKAECAILASDADDEDLQDVLPGLAVVVYPKMAVFTEEDFSAYVLYGRSNGIKENLYGG